MPVAPAFALVLCVALMALPVVPAKAASNRAPFSGGTAPVSAGEKGPEAVGASQKARGATEGGELSKAEAPSAKGGEDKGSAANKDLTLADLPEEQVITAADLEELCEKDRRFKEFTIIDVRSIAKYDAGHIPGAFCVPAGRVFEIRMREAPRDKDVVLIDADGLRVAEAWQTLVDNDYDPERIKVISDGYEAWVDAGLPTEVSTARMWC